MRVLLVEDFHRLRRYGLLMRKKILLGLGGLLVVLVALWFFVLRDDAPPPPSAASAAAVAAAAQTTTLAPSTTAAPATTQAAVSTTSSTSTSTPPTTTMLAGAEGSWVVDTSIGSFADFSNSYVGFRVEEELGRGIGHTTAVGRTPVVSGSFSIEGTALTDVTVVADLSALVTDRTWRDDAVYEALDVQSHPEAVFTFAGPLTVADTPELEQAVTITGTLTIKETTQEIEVDLVAQLVGEIVTVTGQFPVLFSDYEVEVPSAPIVVSVDDEGIVEIQLFFVKAE